MEEELELMLKHQEKCYIKSNLLKDGEGSVYNPLPCYRCDGYNATCIDYVANRTMYLDRVKKQSDK